MSVKNSSIQVWKKFLSSLILGFGLCLGTKFGHPHLVGKQNEIPIFVWEAKVDIRFFLGSKLRNSFLVGKQNGKPKFLREEKVDVSICFPHKNRLRVSIFRYFSIRGAEIVGGSTCRRRDDHVGFVIFHCLARHSKKFPPKIPRPRFVSKTEKWASACAKLGAHVLEPKILYSTWYQKLVYSLIGDWTKNS